MSKPTSDSTAPSKGAPMSYPSCSSASPWCPFQLLCNKKKKQSSKSSNTTENSRRASLDSQNTLVPNSSSTPPAVSSKAAPPSYEQSFATLSSSHGLTDSTAAVAVPILPKDSTTSSPAPTKREKVDKEPQRAALAAWGQYRH